MGEGLLTVCVRVCVCAGFVVDWKSKQAYGVPCSRCQCKLLKVELRHES